MTNDFNINTTVCNRIAELRRDSGMTQNTLADKLGVSFQAVSKWENALSCPDITLLPLLADIFEISIDSLFGREKHEGTSKIVENSTNDPVLPWKNDETLRIALFEGTRLIQKEEYRNEKANISIELDGDARDVICDFALTCNDISGSVTLLATGEAKLVCNDIGGELTAKNVKVTCGDIGGAVTIASDESAPTSLEAGDIGGELTMSNATVTCGEINGNTTVAGNKDDAAKLEADEINGELIVSCATVTCGEINGNTTVVGKKDDPAKLEADEINGDLTIKNAKVFCDEIGGNVFIEGGTLNQN